MLLALDQGLWDCERSLAELSALCEANHMEAVAEVTQKRQTPETGIVLGSGKLEEASLAAESLGAECAVFDGELTGSQIRNISTALGGMEVIDRTMLILEIFRSRAVTNEGKLQTELALLRYRLPRLQGMGEALSRQGGGGGGGGAAVLIGVGAAAAITAGVIMMSPVEIKGRVVLADQAAVPGAKISLLREGKVVAQTTADENGSFSLKAKRGSYELTAAYTTADGQLIYKTIDIKAPAKDLTVTF